MKTATTGWSRKNPTTSLTVSNLQRVAKYSRTKDYKHYLSCLVPTDNAGARQGNKQTMNVPLTKQTMEIATNFFELNQKTGKMEWSDAKQLAFIRKVISK